MDSTVPKELPSEGTPEKASKKATRGKRQKKEEKDENILPKADEKPAKRATKRNAVPITAEAKKIKPGAKKPTSKAQSEVENTDENGSISEETDVVSSENVEGTSEKELTKVARGKRQKKEDDQADLPKADEKPAKRAAKRNAVPTTVENTETKKTKKTTSKAQSESENIDPPMVGDLREVLDKKAKAASKKAPAKKKGASDDNDEGNYCVLERRLIIIIHIRLCLAILSQFEFYDDMSAT